MVKRVTVLEMRPCLSCGGTGVDQKDLPCESCGGSGSVDVQTVR